MNQEKNTAVVTVLVTDRVGIIADVSRLLADYWINIKDISQTILDDIFTMVMMVDLKDVVIEESDISEKLGELGKKLGVQITIQHTGLFNAMHTIWFLRGSYDQRPRNNWNDADVQRSASWYTYDYHGNFAHGLRSSHSRGILQQDLWQDLQIGRITRWNRWAHKQEIRYSDHS